MQEMTKEDILALVPQQEPFRFLDEIKKLDDDGIEAVYTFKGTEDFYRGHFPGRPVTPGVILLESSAQAGVVAYGIYLASKEMETEEIKKIVTVFTEANIEFTGIVNPGDRVTIRARKVYFRRLKLKVEIECALDDGKVVLSGTIAGMGVKDL